MEPAFSAPPTNSLMDKFELSFMNCIHCLTKEESSNGSDKDEIKVEVENTIANFIDLARQMECFFLQKRFQLSCLKPELLLKEENNDLRHEIARKEELLKKHATKIAKWKEFLSDTSPPINPQSPMNPTQLPPYPQMQHSMGQSMMGPNLGPQQNLPPQMHQPGFGITHRSPFAQGMQNPTNPLAFLEKTTNNIDMGGPSRA